MFNFGTVKGTDEEVAGGIRYIPDKKRDVSLSLVSSSDNIKTESLIESPRPTFATKGLKALRPGVYTFKVTIAANQVSMETTFIEDLPLSCPEALYIYGGVIGHKNSTTDSPALTRNGNSFSGDFGLIDNSNVMAEWGYAGFLFTSAPLGSSKAEWYGESLVATTRIDNKYSVLSEAKTFPLTRGSNSYNPFWFIPAGYYHFEVAFTDGKANVTVTPIPEKPVTSIELTDYELNLTLNEIVSMSATLMPSDATFAPGNEVEWESSDDHVAKFINGKVYGRGVGQCILTCTNKWGKEKATATCKVTVKDKSVGINEVFTDNSVRHDVYNLQGIPVLRDADRAACNTLASGVYIVAGKKIRK